MRYGKEDLQEIRDVLDCDEIAMCSFQNTKTKLFERKLEKYMSVEFAVAVSSGTAALHLALLSCGVGVGDEVLVDPLFEYGALATLRCNAVPVFYDVNIDSYMPDVNNLINMISPRTKAIIITNVFGCTADLPHIKGLCNKLNIKLIEDCSHAIMCKCHEKFAGTYGDIGVLSFHSSLHLSLGGGGMLMTSNISLYKTILALRDQKTHLLSWGYEISELISAIGITQLEKIGNVIHYCKTIGNWIGSNLQSPYIVAQKNEYSDHMFWRWAGRINDDELFKFLEKNFDNNYVTFGLNSKSIVNDSCIFKHLKREDIYTCPYDCIFSRENCKEPIELINANAIAKHLLIIKIKFGTPLDKYKNMVQNIMEKINEFVSNKKCDCL